MVQNSDRRRSAYLYENYGIDWDDPALYHFVLNTGRTSLETAAQLFEQAVACLEEESSDSDPGSA